MQNQDILPFVIYFFGKLRYNIVMFRHDFFSARKIAVLGILTALGLIAFLIENAFPPLFGIPGTKMGIANIFTLLALIFYSPAEAFLVVIARTILGAMFQANFSSVMFSFTGGIVAIFAASLLFYFVYPKISLIVVSVVSAVLHNLTQNAVYVLETGTTANFSLLPYYTLIGIASGAVVGAICLTIVKILPKRSLQLF